MYLKKSILFCSPLFLCSYLPTSYALSGISELDGFPGSITAPSGVSDMGNIVVGTTYGSNGPQAFRWDYATNQMSGLGALVNGGTSLAQAVNASGDVVVGTSTTSNASTRAFRWTLATNSMSDLGLLPNGTFSEAYGVNAAGDVVVGKGDSTNRERAFRWTLASNSMTDLGVLPGTNSSGANGVNASGDVVVGYSDNKAFRWTLSSNSMTDLGALPGSVSSAANAVNDVGDVVVGISDFLSGARAFRWTLDSNSMTDLGTLAGGSFSFAQGVNAAGDVVVGISGSALGPKGFRWTTANGMQSVDEWLIANGVAVGNVATTSATGVSADGNVVVGQLSNSRAYIARVTAAGSGLIDVQDFNSTLQATASASSLVYGNIDTVLNGLHGSPDHELLTPGKAAVWVSGDLGLTSSSERDKDAAGEFGVKVGIADGWQGEIALGRRYARNDTLYDGKNTFSSTYVAPGISYRIPDTQLLVGLLAYYDSGELDLRRGYLNAGLPVTSAGSPDVKSMAARLRVDWLDAFTIGPISVTPYTSLTWSKYKVDSYTETGGGFPVKWDQQKDTAQVARIGVDNTWNATNALSFVVRAEYANRLDAQGDRVNGQIVGLNPFSLDGYSYQKNWMRVGLGTEYKLGNASTISATLNGTTQSDMPKTWLNLTYTQAF